MLPFYYSLGIVQLSCLPESCCSLADRAIVENLERVSGVLAAGQLLASLAPRLKCRTRIICVQITDVLYLQHVWKTGALLLHVGA